MIEKTQEKRVVKKYITIYDLEIWAFIDKIMELPEYSKSFNKVINHALKYGVAKLYELLFIQANDDENKIDGLSLKDIVKSPEEKKTEDCMKEIVLLLREDIMNLLIIKSMLSSLHNVKSLEIGGGKINKEIFDDGAYRQTPKYLEEFELSSIKDIRKRRNEID